MPSSRVSRGHLLAVAAASLWGVSGTFGQFLFQQRGISPEWLVGVRMLISGAILLIIAQLHQREHLHELWTNRRDRLQTVVFGIFGMLAVQYTYFAAIRSSNAATATVLQYLGPVLIAAYYAYRERRIPVFHEILALLCAIGGTFLLVTHGRIDSLSISGEALFWGLTSAVALAIYSVQPSALLRKYPSSLVVGCGMMIGGLAMSLVHPPWDVVGQWDMSAYVGALFIILFGTLAPFYAYLTAVRMVGAKTASLLACAEPLSAALTAVLWLKVSFGGFDWIGTWLIVTTIVLLTAIPRRETTRAPG